MAKAQSQDSIRELSPGLWQAGGSLPFSPLPRNMVIYRLPDGGLLIHSAVALDDAGMTALEALGTPKVLVVPNRFHRSDAAFFKARYPSIQVLCPAAAHGPVTRMVPVDASAEEALPPLGVICHVPAGVRPSELAYEFKLSSGRALIFTDLLFNLQKLPGLGGMMVNLAGSTGYFGITRIGKLFLLKDGTQFRQWLLNLAELPGLEAICVAHGDAILSNCAAQLKEAAARIN